MCVESNGHKTFKSPLRETDEWVFITLTEITVT